MLSIHCKSHNKLIETIGGHPERITKAKPFIDKHNWERVHYEKDNSEKMTRKSSDCP